MPINKQLTEQVATEIGGALARVAELSGKSIVESTDAAERRGLEAFLQRTLVEHAPELVGAWFTVRHQYRPLVQGVTALLSNALASIDRANAASKPCCEGGCKQAE